MGRPPPPMRRLLPPLFLLAGAVALLPGCGLLFGRTKPPPVIEGAVTYRERLDLPANALLRIRLSRADSLRDVIAETTFAAAGRQVPFPYTLRYDPDRIERRQTYAVRAVILDGDRILFGTNGPVNVITTGAQRSADLVLGPPRRALRFREGGTEEVLQQDSARAVLAGTVSYRVRSALPSAARVTVRLLETTADSTGRLRTDVRPRTVADTTFAPEGWSVPLAFVLRYRPGDVRPARRYAVEAEIAWGERVRFATTAPVPVLGPDGGGPLALDLVPTGGGRPRAATTGVR